MTVPKTAVYKNHCVVMRKKNVGRADVAFVVFAESESSFKKRFSQEHFGLCVFVVDF